MSKVTELNGGLWTSGPMLRPLCLHIKQTRQGRKQKEPRRPGQARKDDLHFRSFVQRVHFPEFLRGSGGEQAGSSCNLLYKHLGAATQAGGLFLLRPRVPSTLFAVSTEWQKSRPSTFQTWEMESWGKAEGGKAPLGRGIPERAGGADARAKNSPGWGEDVVGWGCGYPVVFFLPCAPPRAFF